MQMELDTLPGISRLYADYLSGGAQSTALFHLPPFAEDAVKRQAEVLSKADYDRQNLSHMLYGQNLLWEADEAALNNCRRLAEDNCFAVVTGQQVGLLGGPLFILFKALHAVKLAASYEQLLGNPVVPIFWLELEDHDLKEVNQLTAKNTDHELISLSLAIEEGDGRRPVKDIFLGREIERLLAELEWTWMQTEFSEELFALLRHTNTPDSSFATAFSGIISALLSRYGLVLADPSHPHFKRRAGSLFLREIESPLAGRENFVKHTKEIVAAKYHAQVETPHGGLHLFLMVNGSKYRLATAGESFRLLGTSNRVGRSELMYTIEREPEKLVPAVLLRPLVQDTLFPTLAYVAGPAEVAYLAQLKPVYEQAGVSMPVVMPRAGGTVLGPSEIRIIEKYKIECRELFQTRDELVRHVHAEHMPNHARLLFQWVKQEILQSLARLKVGLDSVEEGYVQATETAESKITYQLEKLEERYNRALERTNDTVVRQLSRLANSIFPKGALQERVLPTAQFLNQFGPGLIDGINNAIDPLRPKHHFIKI